MAQRGSFWGGRKLYDGGPLARAHAELAVRADVLTKPTRRLVARDDETCACQVRLARISSPTGGEAARAAAFLQLMHDAGWSSARLDGAGNVVARHASGIGALAEVSPVVCMAHLDTVFPSDTVLVPVREGARVVCPGIGDNSRGLAGLLTLARILAEMNRDDARTFGRPLELIATVGEEGLGNLRGARAYFADRVAAGAPDPHAVIVLDGPGDTRIVHHALGSRRYRVDFRGPGGHSWADFGKPNAVHAAGRAVGWLAELPRAFGNRLALTVSGIGGGESVNAIPTLAWLEIDLRATGSALLERAEQDVRRIVRAAAEQESGVYVGTNALVHDIMLLGERPCGELASDHPLVAVAHAATLVQGLEPISSIASTDANVPLSLGIPALTIGAGGIGGRAHTLHEWYENANAPRGLARALAIIAAMAA
jgi:tripeptide aminopeptidase